MRIQTDGAYQRAHLTIKIEMNRSNQQTNKTGEKKNDNETKRKWISSGKIRQQQLHKTNRITENVLTANVASAVYIVSLTV